MEPLFEANDLINVATRLRLWWFGIISLDGCYFKMVSGCFLSCFMKNEAKSVINVLVFSL